MKKHCALLVLAGLTTHTIAAQSVTSAPTDSALQTCSVEPVRFSSQQLMPRGHVKVEANRTEIIENQVALFSGNVDITSDSATIRANQAQVNENGRDMFAEGDVQYQDKQLRVNSDAISLDQSEERLELTNTRYQLSGVAGRGAADNILLDTDQGLILSDVSFTTCPPGDEDWSIRASEISIEKGTVWGQAKHTRFYLGGVPVFYLPYFAFPVSDQRQTGLLFPEITSSSNTGVDYEQPFYWNMAPNYDMTISPRVMSKRGIQLKTEFRYLTEASYGQVNLEYLPSDRDLSNEMDRYFYRVEHHGLLSDNWEMHVDVNGMSDDNYIVDLGSNFYNRADTHLYRTLAFNYYSPSLTMDLALKDFVVIGDFPNTYRALPEARLNYTTGLGDYLEFRVDSELAYFDNTQDAAPEALRWHLAPTLALPYQRQWGEITAEATLLNTYYQQDNVAGTELEEEVNRTLGQFRLFSALYFERDTQWLGNGSIMTLEPKLQYLYTSYEDQASIGTYDSTVLLTDVDGLFRGQEFTGLDRISDNNQITLGVTSRIIDSANREQFVVSLGQIFYLEKNRLIAATKEEDRSALAGEVDWRLSNTWYFHTDMQVTTDTDKVERSGVALEYRRDNESLVQFTHRFVRDLSGEMIDQAGVSASWPVAKNWHLVGRTYRDLERDRSIENYLGIQYESCCWAIQVVAQRFLSNRYAAGGMQASDEYESGISLQFIFKGMGSSGSSRRMLEDGMFGYRQPYSLN
ncbi:LPS assembly protein LptD [Alteromonas sp. ASW11-19]|uniref:LPS-assembly protein LptD n=1 Tax=Alteromonas salexigens TaxID=2982530 RepID=A0ABT2VJZ8_9ALTE|nr:LPS assembly protein LptD [Alteromonas salexigens]MCU7553112.1 LPS assembly protein LptD [Alteromonas salexigens]